MLEPVRRLWWSLQGWLAGRRLGAITRRLAAGDPIKERLTELCIEADARGIQALTARQQIVVRTWSARGIIGNGGFRYFLEGETPLLPVVDGYRQLGFAEAADACERVMKAIAEAPALDDKGRRTAVFEARGKDAFEAEESAVFAVEWDALQAAIGDFMRSNPRDFPGLPAGSAEPIGHEVRDKQ